MHAKRKESSCRRPSAQRLISLLSPPSLSRALFFSLIGLHARTHGKRIRTRSCFLNLPSPPPPGQLKNGMMLPNVRHTSLSCFKTPLFHGNKKKRRKRDRFSFSYRANLLPYFVASRLLLEAEREVEVVPLRPDDEGLLLLLVRRVGLDLGLQQKGTLGGRKIDGRR